MAENTQQQPRRRGAGRPFTKGQSGNPGGRPKVAAEVKELAQQHGREAVETLVRLMREAEKDEVRVRAAESLLDRGYGRPTQAVTGEGGGPVEFVIRDVAKEGE